MEQLDGDVDNESDGVDIPRGVPQAGSTQVKVNVGLFIVRLGSMISIT